MFAGAALVLCLTNATDVVANGQLRDGRTKTTSAQLPGASLTYREPVAQHALPTVAPGRTECASFDPAPLTRPQLVVWSAAPVAHLPEGGRVGRVGQAQDDGGFDDHAQSVLAISSFMISLVPP